MAVVYKHIRKDTNEVFYIGIGRYEKRSLSLKNRNKYWHNIVNKTDYDVEILYTDITWEQACEKEIELIKYYGRKDLGSGCLVNMTDGGEGSLGQITSIETRKKQSDARKGKLISIEIRKILSDAQKGKIVSDETRKNMSEGQKKRSDNHCKKMNEAKQKIREEAKLKL